MPSAPRRRKSGPNRRPVSSRHSDQYRDPGKTADGPAPAAGGHAKAGQATAVDTARDVIYEKILDEAAPIADIEVALDAELAVSALLGGVYATSDTGRDRAVRAFAAEFGRYLARRRSLQARAVRAGLAAILPGEVSAPSGKSAAPDWAAVAGKVTCTGTWAVADSYGDQTQYVATFAYADADLGGPEHAVSYLLDHNLGYAKDVSIGAPADQVVASWQTEAERDPDITIDPADPAELRGAVTAYLTRTDALEQPPAGRYAEDRAFALARLAVLPEGEHARPTLSDGARDALVADFLAAPEAAAVGGGPVQAAPSTQVLAWCARAAADFAVDDNDGDPLRWSPTSVELMLLHWAPAQLSRTHPAVPWLPEVLDAFLGYAARLKGQSDQALEATRAAVTGCAVQYTDAMTGETLGEPVMDILARMVADGVDPMDEDAVLKWVLADRARRGLD
ncbi:MAG: hypothetical protein GEU94_04700 [Micromonosporaceae bacterium]|nr:hypothetical protein [Micromonosporaceae bacterium]